MSFSSSKISLIPSILKSKYGALLFSDSWKYPSETTSVSPVKFSSVSTSALYEVICLLESTSKFEVSLEIVNFDVLNTLRFPDLSSEIIESIFSCVPDGAILPSFKISTAPFDKFPVQS